MIKSDKEYTISKKKVQEMSQQIKELKKLHGKKNPAFWAIESFKQQIQEEIAEYEQIKSGVIPQSLFNFENLGLLLIALRIRQNLTQTQLAVKLGVAPSQVSRDENNDYHGVTMPTVKKILEALEVKLVLKVAPWTI